MICKECGQDKPLNKFSTVTFKYITKAGAEKVYTSVRKRCNACTWKKNKPVLRIDRRDRDTRLTAY